MHLQPNRIAMPRRRAGTGTLPEEQLVILWILSGCPGNGTSEDFLEWAWTWYFHQKGLGRVGRTGISARTYCQAMYNNHFHHWTNAEVDENGKKAYWP